MDGAFRIAAFSFVTLILVLTVGKEHRDLAAVLALGACAVLSAAVFRLMDPILRLIKELSEAAGLHGDLMEPLVKTVGIGLLTRLTVGACRDAGQQALSTVTELGGTVLCLLAALPVLQAVLDLIKKLVGG